MLIFGASDCGNCKMGIEFEHTFELRLLEHPRNQWKQFQLKSVVQAIEVELCFNLNIEITCV